jgi:hypothetical protein
MATSRPGASRQFTSLDVDKPRIGPTRKRSSSQRTSLTSSRQKLGTFDELVSLPAPFGWAKFAKVVQKDEIEVLGLLVAAR